MDDKFLFKVVKGQTFGIVAQDGTANGYDPGLPEDLLLKMYRFMVLGRSYDEKAVKLQAAGRMGTYPPISGQEAVQVGSALALEPDDWLVPSYRELAAMMVKGVPLKTMYLAWMGNDYGNALPPDLHCLPLTIPVGSQALHATGFAWAAKTRREKYAVLCHFGDGATSRGDFHEALNFAGVWHVPVVFVVQNNQWAISVPLKKQTHSRTLAQKALAYGIPGLQVDGNDVLAVYAACTEAVGRARAGDGPTLIECVTYRLGVHTTADDPTKYRSAEEVEAWERKDPLTRFGAYLQKKQLLDDGVQDAVDAEIAEAVKRFEAVGAPDPLGMFEHAYATRPPHLEAQRAELAARLRNGHGAAATPAPASAPPSPPMRGQRTSRR